MKDKTLINILERELTKIYDKIEFLLSKIEVHGEDPDEDEEDDE
jgi:hypothetical protein